MVSFLVGITYLDKILMIRPSNLACWGGRIAHTILSGIIELMSFNELCLSAKVSFALRLALLEALKVKKVEGEICHLKTWTTSSASTQRRFKNMHALSSSRIKLMLTNRTNKSGRPLKTTSTMKPLDKINYSYAFGLTITFDPKIINNLSRV